MQVDFADDYRNCYRACLCLVWVSGDAASQRADSFEQACGLSNVRALHARGSKARKRWVVTQHSTLEVIRRCMSWASRSRFCGTLISLFSADLKNSRSSGLFAGPTLQSERLLVRRSDGATFFEEGRLVALAAMRDRSQVRRRIGFNQHASIRDHGRGTRGMLCASETA